jgi:hypothetical protein
MRRLIDYLRVLRAKILIGLFPARWRSPLDARIAIVAAFISVIGALGTVWSARFAGDQASSARVSAKAAEEAVPYARASAETAIETLRRSDEDLRILVDVDYHAPVTVSFTVSDEYSSFSIRFPATAVIINTGGSPAVVMDSIVGTYAASEYQGDYQSRNDIYDASTAAAWPKLAVIRPNELLRLSLLGNLVGSNRQLPTVSKALATLFSQREHQNGRLQRQFDSFAALSEEVHSHAGQTANEFDRFLYGPAAKPGTISSNPWSEKEETGYSRIILRVRTASRRTYRSSPGLLMVGPDPAYSIQEVPRQ